MTARLVIAVAALAASALGADIPATHSGSPAPAQEGPPVFSAQSELVVLQVMVEDGRHAYVTDLKADAFTVREDGASQTIAFFNQLDSPVNVGLIVDGSGSMQAVRGLVASAADGFVRASNPEDEMFALTFSDAVRPLLPDRAPFTNSATTLRAALTSAITSRGRTALYDAIVEGLRYADLGMYERKALVVISDGGDNASMSTFDDVLDTVRLSNAVIDTIAIVDPVGTDGDPGRLKKLAEASGGESLKLESIDQTPAVLQRVARDIRNMYTIGYSPSHSGGDGFRRIRVDVRAPGYGGLRVRTRDGYLAGKR
jgi:Ca-activated chloride channel family protein